MAASLKAQILEDIKAAMKAQDKLRLGTLRLLSSALKQIEVDNRVELDDPGVLAIIEKNIKQRRESIKQFEAGGRADLAANEQAELDILAAYLPAPLSEAELTALIDQSISATGAAGIKDMGKVMALLKPQVQGKCDMGALSGLIKARLNG
jgi:uncharacterized protein YqeY